MRRFLPLIITALLLAGSIFFNRLAARLHSIVPVRPGEVAYLATFDSDLADWNLSKGVLQSEIRPEGVLRLDVGDVNRLPFAEARFHFADMDLRAQASAVGGPLNNGFGLVFRLDNKGNSSPDDDDFYLFEVSSDGYYRVYRSLNGTGRELSTWIPSAVVNQGLGAVNWLRVVAQGGQFRFFANNQPLQLCVPDGADARSTYNTVSGECLGGQMRDVLVDDAISSGQIGVAAQTFEEPGVIVEFDNVMVLGPVGG